MEASKLTNEQVIRKLYEVVEGPLEMPGGAIPSTGKKIHVPCCDVFHLRDGKVTSFHCYNAATITLGQLGVLDHLSAAYEQNTTTA